MTGIKITDSQIATVGTTSTEPSLPDWYVLARDSDFKWEEDLDGSGYWHYIGTAGKVAIPHIIQGKEVTSYRDMFANTSVSGVFSNNQNVTDMSYMFDGSTTTHLDLKYLDTSSVTNMRGMFKYSQAIDINLSKFDTRNVTDMCCMFYGSQVIHLDLFRFKTSNVTNTSYMFFKSQSQTLNISSFDISNVTNMYAMFYDSQAITLNLSSFDTSKVATMRAMFTYSQATTGYARTQEEADKFNSLASKPSRLVFKVKPVAN